MTSLQHRPDGGPLQ